MIATKDEDIQAVLAKMPKRCRIAMRQEFGSAPIKGISYDAQDGRVVVRFGADRASEQHSFFYRKSGALVHKTVSQVYEGWDANWKKA